MDSTGFAGGTAVFAGGTAGFVVGTGRRTEEQRSSQDTAVYLIKRYKTIFSETSVKAINKLIKTEKKIPRIIICTIISS